MSARPTKMEFEVGRDAYGRAVKVICERAYDGKDVWRIWRDQANQRDEIAICDGLTLDNLKAIGRIAEEQR